MSLINRLPKIRGQYRENVNLGKFCWFGVGGSASILYKPADIEDLQYFMANLKADIPYFIFGVGSNLLVSDAGFNGVAIRLGREFNFINQINDTTLKIGASTLDLNISHFAAETSIGCLEFFSGIPGTFGGALAMNAGAYTAETKDVLVSARAINRKGELKEFNNDQIGYSYRSKGLSSDWIFVDGIVKGNLGIKEDIENKITQIQNARFNTQPIKSKTGGSTFKNPNGYKAWELIDKAGCRGLTIGGAMVSPMHCNFFINTGNSSASDLINLIQQVKNRVYQSSGINLQEEIKIINF